MSRNLVGIGKFLSLVLRHNPQLIGLELDQNGWADVQELIDKTSDYQLKNNYRPFTKSLLDEVVSTNDKKRYEYSPDGLKIRASQGHSLNINLGLVSKVPPEYLYHGTADRFIDSIKKDGLKKMSRNHVHLNEDANMSIKVGERHGKPNVLRIKSKDMSHDDFVFYLSSNNVWLTEEIPAKYIDFDWK